MNQNKPTNSEELLSDETFVNYLLNSNGKDVRYWMNWIRLHPECRNEVEEARALFFAIRPGAAAGNTPPMELEKFLAMLEPEKQAGTALQRKPVLRWAVSVAALFLLVLGAWWLFKPAAHTSFAYYSNHENNSKEVMLPDGTRVLLNADAFISIPADYNENNRKVELQGAAFFKVAKNPAKPFKVNASGVVTTAIGTAFYIHRHPVSNAIQVSLLEGKVKVDAGGSTQDLLPGQQAICGAEGRVTTGGFDSTQLGNWTRKKIIFEKASLQEISNTLETFFNYRVNINGTLQNTSFTGSFGLDNPKEILESLKFTNNIQYTVRGNQLTLSLP